jgi:23S rRNA pseudouridine1911/1915/1917 synthase
MEEGRVTRNGSVVVADAKLATGDALEWARPPWEEPDVPRAYTILYEDDDLLAVDKPSGLPVLPGGGYVENTLLHLLQMRTPECPPGQ